VNKYIPLFPERDSFLMENSGAGTNGLKAPASDTILFRIAANQWQ
jgi:hypothetical protein